MTKKPTKKRREEPRRDIRHTIAPPLGSRQASGRTTGEIDTHVRRAARGGGSLSRTSLSSSRTRSVGGLPLRFPTARPDRYLPGVLAAEPLHQPFGASSASPRSLPFGFGSASLLARLCRLGCRARRGGLAPRLVARCRRLPPTPVTGHVAVFGRSWLDREACLGEPRGYGTGLPSLALIPAIS